MVLPPLSGVPNASATRTAAGSAPVLTASERAVLAGAVASALKSLPVSGRESAQLAQAWTKTTAGQLAGPDRSDTPETLFPQASATALGEIAELLKELKLQVKLLVHGNPHTAPEELTALIDRVINPDREQGRGSAQQDDAEQNEQQKTSEEEALKQADGHQHGTGAPTERAFIHTVEKAVRVIATGPKDFKLWPTSLRK